MLGAFLRLMVFVSGLCLLNYGWIVLSEKLQLGRVIETVGLLAIAAFSMYVGYTVDLGKKERSVERERTKVDQGK